jgi:hypothetical protein
MECVACAVNGQGSGGRELQDAVERAQGDGTVVEQAEANGATRVEGKDTAVITSGLTLMVAAETRAAGSHIAAR